MAIAFLCLAIGFLALACLSDDDDDGGGGIINPAYMIAT